MAQQEHVKRKLQTVTNLSKTMMNLIKNVISEVDKQREDMIKVIENLVQFVDPIDYEGENSSQGRT